MNNNEIMNNEVVEATEEVIENAGLSKGVYVAKPVIANIKAQIEQKKMAAEEKRRLSWKNPMLSLKTTENANLRSSDKGEYL